MTETRILPLVILMLSLIVPATVTAQVPVKVSNEKTVSGGKVYYMHEVQKGQTLYSISRAYKVKIDDITGENVIPSSGIQTGQVLRIPVSEGVTGPASGSSATGQAIPMPKPRPVTEAGSGASMHIDISDQKIISNNKVYFMHQVLKGQTLYSIARAYKVTILDIDRENVIPPSGIQAGQILKIPESSSLTVTTEVMPPPVERKPENTTTQARANPPEPEKAQRQMPHQENAATPAQMPHQENAATPAQMPHQESTATRTQMPYSEKPVEPSTEATRPAKDVAQKTEEVTPPVQETPDQQAEEQQTNPATETAQQEEPEPDTYKRIVHKVRKGESLSEIADKYGVTVQDIRKTNKGVIFAMPDMRLVILVKEEPDSN